MDWRIGVIIVLVFTVLVETLLLIKWLGPQRSPIILLIMLPVLMVKAALIAWIDIKNLGSF